MSIGTICWNAIIICGALVACGGLLCLAAYMIRALIEIITGKR